MGTGSNDARAGRGRLCRHQQGGRGLVGNLLALDELVEYYLQYFNKVVGTQMIGGRLNDGF